MPSRRDKKSRLRAACRKRTVQVSKPFTNPETDRNLHLLPFLGGRQARGPATGPCRVNFPTLKSWNGLFLMAPTPGLTGAPRSCWQRAPSRRRLPARCRVESWHHNQRRGVAQRFSRRSTGQCSHISAPPKSCIGHSTRGSEFQRTARNRVPGRAALRRTPAARKSEVHASNPVSRPRPSEGSRVLHRRLDFNPQGPGGVQREIRVAQEFAGQQDEIGLP